MLVSLRLKRLCDEQRLGEDAASTREEKKHDQVTASFLLRLFSYTEESFTVKPETMCFSVYTGNRIFRCKKPRKRVDMLKHHLSFSWPRSAPSSWVVLDTLHHTVSASTQWRKSFNRRRRLLKGANASLENQHQSD